MQLTVLRRSTRLQHALTPAPQLPALQAPFTLPSIVLCWLLDAGRTEACLVGRHGRHDSSCHVLPPPSRPYLYLAPALFLCWSLVSHFQGASIARLNQCASPRHIPPLTPFF